MSEPPIHKALSNDLGKHRPDTAATGGRQRGGDLGETTEQLPKYEAAPPGYDTLYKDGHPVAQDTELSNNGESSTAAAAAGGRGSGEVAINMEPAHQASSQAQPPPPFSSENPGAPPRQ